MSSPRSTGSSASIPSARRSAGPNAVPRTEARLRISRSAGSSSSRRAWSMPSMSGGSGRSTSVVRWSRSASPTCSTKSGLPPVCACTRATRSPARPGPTSSARSRSVSCRRSGRGRTTVARSMGHPVGSSRWARTSATGVPIRRLSSSSTARDARSTKRPSSTRSSVGPRAARPSNAVSAAKRRRSALRRASAPSGSAARAPVSASTTAKSPPWGSATALRTCQGSRLAAPTASSRRLLPIPTGPTRSATSIADSARAASRHSSSWTRSIRRPWSVARFGSAPVATSRRRPSTERTESPPIRA